MVDRHSPRECLSPPLFDDLPTKCQQLSKGFSECKSVPGPRLPLLPVTHITNTDVYRRGMIDMRKRFRGNAPISIPKAEGGGKKPGSGQLYAGKPAFESVKEISGDEVQMDPEKTRGL